MSQKKIQPLTSEEDRATLRKYLTLRLRVTRRSIRHAQDREERSYHEGAEMELMFLFDDLLGEEPPDLRKKPIPQ